MSKFKISPLGDRVIIKPNQGDEKTAGGIILPDTAKEKSTEGRVIALGPGKVASDGLLIKPKVQIGDTVLFGKFNGTEIKVDGEEYLIMHETDLFGIVNQ